MLDPRLVEQIASALGAVPGLVEKDWHVVRAIRVLAALDHGEARPVFSGGTSLSIGWGLIKRFSEDIDFKIIAPAAATSAAARTQRRAYREKVIAALSSAEFQLVNDPQVGNESRYFFADFAYPTQFNPEPGLRAHLRLEMTFDSPALSPVARPIQSIVSRAQKSPPEVPAFDCVDPVETAANKLSALAWRVCVRERGAQGDDPTIIRHLHDLAALEQYANSAPAFMGVLRDSLAVDSGRGGGRAPQDPIERINRMLELLGADSLWAREYDEFVRNVSFASPDEVISFSKALGAVRRLADQSTKDTRR